MIKQIQMTTGNVKMAILLFDSSENQITDLLQIRTNDKDTQNFWCMVGYEQAIRIV